MARKRTSIWNLEIVLAVIPIEIKNIQVDEKTFKEYQKEYSHNQNCKNDNQFLPGVDLSHLPNHQRKFLVEECEVFSKDENEISFIENLKLKLNFKDDTVFLFTTTPKNS